MIAERQMTGLPVARCSFLLSRDGVERSLDVKLAGVVHVIARREQPAE